VCWKVWGSGGTLWNPYIIKGHLMASFSIDYMATLRGQEGAEPGGYDVVFFCFSIYVSVDWWWMLLRSWCQENRTEVVRPWSMHFGHQVVSHIAAPQLRFQSPCNWVLGKSWNFVHIMFIRHVTTFSSSLLRHSSSELVDMLWAVNSWVYSALVQQLCSLFWTTRMMSRSHDIVIKYLK